MSVHWSRALVTIDDLVAFRDYVEAQGRSGFVALPPRLTLRGAAYPAVKERFLLGDIAVEPREAARGVGDTISRWWKGPFGSCADLVRQTATLVTDVMLNNSHRRAAGLVAGLYGSIVHDSDRTLVLALNPSAEQSQPEAAFQIAS